MGVTGDGMMVVASVLMERTVSEGVARRLVVVVAGPMPRLRPLPPSERSRLPPMVPASTSTPRLSCRPSPSPSLKCEDVVVAARLRYEDSEEGAAAVAAADEEMDMDKEEEDEEAAAAAK